MIKLGALALMSIMAGVALALMTDDPVKESPEMTSQAMEVGYPFPTGETVKATPPHVASYRQKKQ